MVTVFIIITLAVLAFSGIFKLRTAGDKVVAIRNITELHIANAGYAADNNGQYVPIYAFDDTGSKYVAWMNSPDYLNYLKGETPLYRSNGTVDTKLPINMMDPVTARAKKKSYDLIAASFGYITNGVPGSGWGKPNSTSSYRISQLTSPSAPPRSSQPPTGMSITQTASSGKAHRRRAFSRDKGCPTATMARRWSSIMTDMPAKSPSPTSRKSIPKAEPTTSSGKAAPNNSTGSPNLNNHTVLRSEIT